MELWLNGLLALGGSVGASLALLVLVKRLPFARKLRDTNDIAGYYITVVGTVYAVILAFMFFAVWNRFETAMDVADQEGVAALDMYRLSPGLPTPLAKRLQAEIREYTRLVLEREWPAMVHKDPLGPLGEDADPLFTFMIHSRPDTPREQAVFDTINTRFLDMSKNRRERILKAEATLPSLLWGMMIVGAVITIGFSCLFGVEHFQLHAFKTSLMTAMIVVVLYVIAALDQPFHGDIHVQPEAFRVAQGQFERMDKKWATDGEMGRMKSITVPTRE